MNSVEKVKALCKQKNIPISRLERELGFGNGYIGQLRKGSFPDDRLFAIAKYLDVSFEYLMGETSQKKPAQESAELTEEQIRAIEKIKNMPPEELAKKMAALEAVLDM